MGWSVGALEGSIIADYTPKATRARWKALNAVSGMGFSGSAALGGWIIDRYGFGPCFMLTACFQASALPLLFSLRRVVALESDIADTVAANKVASTSEIASPLLQKPSFSRRSSLSSPGPTTLM